jgi:hypothetical protein
MAHHIADGSYPNGKDGIGDADEGRMIGAILKAIVLSQEI